MMVGGGWSEAAGLEGEVVFLQAGGKRGDGGGGSVGAGVVVDEVRR